MQLSVRRTWPPGISCRYTSELPLFMVVVHSNGPYLYRHRAYTSGAFP